MNKFRFILVMTFFFLLLVACSTTDANEEPDVVEATLPVATAVPAQPTIAPTEAPVEVEPETDTLESFVEQLQTAVIDQDYAAMQALMDDSMLVAGWRSEGRVYEPAPMVAEFQNDSLPAPTAVQFTGLTEAELTNLLGQPPASILGPTATVVATLHSEGWGVEGNDEAILYVTEEDGRYAWSAFLYTFGSFAQNDDDTDSSIFVAETDINYVQAQQDVIMYSGPADTYDEIGSIFDGQMALVTGQSEDGAWWRVICPDDTIGDCWVTAVPAFTVPINPEAGATIPVVETDVKYVQAQQDVVMYSGPADTYDEIGGIFDGQTALVTGQSEDGAWWRVICPDDTIGDCWVTADTALTLPTTP